MSKPAISKSTISGFLATIKKHNFHARGNRFEVDFSALATTVKGVSAADAREMSEYVQSVRIPGRQFASFEYSDYRNSIDIINGYTNEAVSVDFLNPGDHFIRRIFDKWMDAMISTKTYAVQYAKKYKVPSIHIKQLDDNDKIIYDAEITDVFPKGVNGIGLTSSTGDVTTTAVELSYNSLLWNKDPAKAAK